MILLFRQRFVAINSLVSISTPFSRTFSEIFNDKRRIFLSYFIINFSFSLSLLLSRVFFHTHITHSLTYLVFLIDMHFPRNFEISESFTCTPPPLSINSATRIDHIEIQDSFDALISRSK